MDVEAEILSWIHGTLSRPQAFLGNIPPCPYAAEAVLRSQVHISHASPDLMIDQVKQGMREFAGRTHRVHVIAVPLWQTVSVETVQTLVRECREIFFKQNLWLLYDHPLNAEVVQDFCFNNGSWLLFFIQDLSELVLASRELAKAGYYDQWPEDYKIKVLHQREQYYQRYLALQASNSELKSAP